ncbi:MAG: PD-(D/E)XK nuclease family transposase [Pirellulaceae bacterium]
MTRPASVTANSPPPYLLELLREPLDFWLYFFQNAEGLDADPLPGPLARPEIREAMEVLKVFTESDVERNRYENRLKALRDQRSFEYARDEAIRAGDAAQKETKQELVKRVPLAQRLLGHSLTLQDQLLNQPLDQLRMLADKPEKQLLAQADFLSCCTRSVFQRPTFSASDGCLPGDRSWLGWMYRRTSWGRNAERRREFRTILFEDAIYERGASREG